ncbi:ATP-binding cassette transporter [Dorcoceras hygrometricum]|uniref:ATP-binding cassette transporter n=1 Tax=Dorcoceras hygrometricum TaxID=472368 RepID=A0A2Z7AXZ8_9LAMI|nr:ATP-binding cassette transporter [Dorcoceras hygrometricum]
MTSSVTSSFSRSYSGMDQQRASTSSWYLELAIAKRCRVNKLERQRFAFARRDQQMKRRKRKRRHSAGRVCVVNQSQDSVATQRFPDAVFAYPVTGIPGAKKRRSSEAQQLKNESAAKQLTTYEELSKTDRSVALKWKEVKIAIWSAEQFWNLSNVKKFNRGYLYSRNAIEEKRRVDEKIRGSSVGATTTMWSLGVLTAAGRGIGSVHVVVGSNLLVEPSEVEEGEM